MPYLPWLWKENRRADLLEIPLVVMDVSLLSSDYMALDPDRIQDTVETLIQRCTAVGGVFTLCWHNTGLVPPFAQHYPGILDALAGNADYDWQTDLKQLRKLLASVLPGEMQTGGAAVPGRSLVLTGQGNRAKRNPLATSAQTDFVH